MDMDVDSGSVTLLKRKGGRSSSTKGGKTVRASGSAKSHGASDAFLTSPGAKSFNLPDTDSSASPYSDGGRKAVVLDSSSVFPGRLSGGSFRVDIYGTSRYGSGYSYGDYGSYVDNRLFPFAFYPIAIYPNYYSCDEHNVDSSERPGGDLSTAIVQSISNTYKSTYRITGDFDSVEALTANTTCGVVNSTDSISTFPPGVNWPYPEQAIQYYCARSFVLSLDSYNNTAALPSNAPESNSSALPSIADTALPLGLNMTFLQCINTTIAASVPLANTATTKYKISIWALFVVASIGGLA